MTADDFQALREEIVWDAMWNYVIPYSIFVGTVIWLFLTWVQRQR